MRKLKVDHNSMKRNLDFTKGGIIAEPLYIILAAQRHPDAHEKVRTLTLQAQHEARPLEEVVVGDAEMKDYLKEMTSRQRQILSNPHLYTGIAAKKAKAVAEKWKQKLGL